MTEAELVYQFNEYVDSSWVFTQWWVSVTFALMAVAHLSAKRLTAFLLIAILVVYTLFSININVSGSNVIQRLDGVVAALERLDAAGQLTEAGLAVLSADERYRSGFFGGVSNGATNALLFFGAIGYLVYRYRKGRGIAGK